MRERTPSLVQRLMAAGAALTGAVGRADARAAERRLAAVQASLSSPYVTATLLIFRHL